jgi:tuberculosinol/isotuberculosinol synthase
LEYGEQEWEDPIAAYMDIAQKRHIELYKMFFDHGVDTLIAPVIGPEILATRDSYMQKIGAEGLARLATHAEFLDFYDQYHVQVNFFGDYQKNLLGTPYEYLSKLFMGLPGRTAGEHSYRLFFGAFADNLNSTHRVVELSIQYFKQHNDIPSREEIVRMYYGDFIEKADLFIGFDRFAVFDYPLINWGEEDIYFMVAPSFYLSKGQLRTILYDHLYLRRAKEVDYISQGKDKLQRIRNFYLENREITLGVGELLDGTWLPKLKNK